MSSESLAFVDSFLKQLEDLYLADLPEHPDLPMRQRSQKKNQYFKKILILIDDGVFRNWPFKAGPYLNFEIIPVLSGEAHKNLEGLSSLWSTFREHGLDRSSLVIIIGGGALLDRAGFAASTYMRGLAFVFVPTTLLSMVDVGIGGKMGINFEGVKNLVGSFYNPEATLINPMFLKTLAKRDFISGFSELIKHALLDPDSQFFREQEGSLLKEIEKFEPEKFDIPMSWLEHSVHFKQSIVDEDPYELLGIRKKLNLGHTLGHALESLSAQTDHPLLHGEAIAIGLVLEAKISLFLGGLSEDEFQFIEKILSRVGLPTDYPSLKSKTVREQLYLYLKDDKKNSHEKSGWSFTLLQSIGYPEVDVFLDKEFLELFFWSFS